MLQLIGVEFLHAPLEFRKERRARILDHALLVLARHRAACHRRLTHDLVVRFRLIRERLLLRLVLRGCFDDRSRHRDGDCERGEGVHP